MSTPSLTVDITDTNLLLDDLLHQLSLHSDYALLRHIKQSYSAIHGSRQQQQAEVKRTVEELSRAVQGLEQSVRTVGVTEVKAWRDGVKGSVSEREEEVQELQVQAGRLAGEVEEKEEEGKELERKRKEMLRKHQDAMQSHKYAQHTHSTAAAQQLSCCPLTRPPSAVRVSCTGSAFASTPSCLPFSSTWWTTRRYAEVTQTERAAAEGRIAAVSRHRLSLSCWVLLLLLLLSCSAYHGVDSAQRSFAYEIDEAKDGCSAFDATNSLWTQLWAPTARETLAKATAQRPQAAAAAVPQQHSSGHFSLVQFAV